jgi:hypothetical protein
MTTIDLTKEQVEELKSFYKLELEKSFKRTTEILGILNKLDDKPETISKPIVQKPEPEIKSFAPIEIKGKYIKWSDAIVELLTEKQKPLSSKEIETILVKQKNIPKSDLKKTNFAIHQSLYRLRTKNKKIQAIKTVGKKAALYGLLEWAKNTETKKPVLAKQNIQAPLINKDSTTRPYGKYNWQGFIKDTLESKKRVLNLVELTNAALKHFELKSSEKIRTRTNLAPLLTKLVKKDKILKTTQKKGFKGRSYGLKEWFDEKGELISIYK